MERTPTSFIKRRRSVRRFTSEPVPRQVVEDILECARLAPTARNVQPWLLGAVTEPKVRRRLAALTDHGKFIAEVPVCFAVFTRAGEKYFLEDGCAATMTVILAAAAHGLGTCWVAGDKKPYAREVRLTLGVPGEYTLISLVACGYADEEPAPAKKPFGEVVFFERSSHAASG